MAGSGEIFQAIDPLVSWYDIIRRDPDQPGRNAGFFVCGIPRTGFRIQHSLPIMSYSCRDYDLLTEGNCCKSLKLFANEYDMKNRPSEQFGSLTI